MKKANKKLASAIVLGLMLAVPVGASAAEASITITSSSYETTTDIDTTGSDKGYFNGNNLEKVEISQDITFTNGGSNSIAQEDNGATNSQAKKNLPLTINAGNNNLTLNGSWKSGAFYVSNGGKIILTAGNIETEGTERTGGIFNAWVGKVDVTASGDITVNGGGAVFAAQRDSSAVAGSKGEVIVKAANVNVDAEQGIWVGNYSSNGNVDDYAKVDITATDENSSINITGSEYVIKAENGSENAVGKAIVNLTADNVVVDGDINALKGADLTVTVDGKGTLTGAIVSDDASSVDINTKGGDFTWNLTGDSTVDVFQVMDSTAAITSTINGNGYNLTVNDAVEGRHGDTVDIRNVNNIYINKEANPEGIDYNIFYANLDGKDDATSTIKFDITGNLQTIMKETSNSEMFTARGGSITGQANNIIVNNVKDGIGADASAASGSDIAKDGSVTLTAKTDIDIRTDNGFTVYARANDGNGKDGNKGTVNLTAGNNITLVSNLDTLGNATISVLGTDFDHESSISMNAGNKLTIINQKVDGDTVEYGTAIKVENGTGDKVTSVTAAGKEIEIKGDIEAANNAKVVIGNADNSSVIDFTGAIKDDNVKDESIAPALFSVDPDAKTPGVTLNMGSGSVWKVTGDSTVSTVNGEGTIKIADDDVKSVNVESVGAESNLTIGNTANITDTFDGNNLAGSIAEYAGRFDIAGDKALTYVADSGSVIGETSAVIDASGNVTSVVEKANENNAGISEMASIGLMAWRAENNDMNKRLGELRNSNGEHGVWARMVRGESEYGAQSIKNVYNTYQLGYDEKLSTNDHWTVGAAISYTDAQSSFTTGSSENTSKGLSFYGSYLGDNGEFVDLIAKYARLDNEFDVVGSGAGSGDYSTNGYSFSAEFGKRNELANDFYFEPQVELTYGRVADVDYVTSKDVKVNQDSMDSLVGRVGFAAGKNIKNGNVYVRASYLYDFDGETSVTFAKEGAEPRTFEEDLGGGWFEFGIGTNINLSDATYLYLDVEKTTGGEVDTNWQWNAGVRYSF